MNPAEGGVHGGLDPNPSPIRPRLHITASNGGHLDLLVAVKSAFNSFERVWITPESSRARALTEAGEVVRPLPKYDKQNLGRAFIKNAVTAARTARDERPSIVVTAGAGATVPFCLFARAMGAELIFVETMARITSPSVSGVILSRIASRVFVQWPEAVALYPKARLCNPALLESIVQVSDAGEGTFVAVGTHRHPFDRLLQMVDDAAASGHLPGPVRAQTGYSSYRPSHMEHGRWLAPSDLEERIRSSRYVITHAGSGLISTALSAGKKPLILARRASFGEHVDDHQQQLAGKLERLGLIVLIGDQIGAEELAEADVPVAAIDQTDTPSVEEALQRELELVAR